MRYVNFICKHNQTIVNEKIPTHNYHSCEIIMSAVLDGWGNIEILYHHFTRIQHRHSFSSPSFHLFHYHLHAFTRKTHSEQKKLLDSLSVHFTERLAMRGPFIWHKPATTTLLELYPEVYQIFL
jgi:hypothetical protein